MKRILLDQGCVPHAAAILRRYGFDALQVSIGLHQDALSYLYLGRKERLTEVRGEIIKDIIS